MHKMDQKKKILTIVGLVLEIASIPSMLFALWIMRNFSQAPGMTDQEFELTKWILNLSIDIVSVMLYVIAFFVVINVLLFTKLIKGRLTEKQAKKVYLYQAIWGGISFPSNQITGILYLISGIGGYQGHKEEKNIREGI